MPAGIRALANLALLAALARASTPAHAEPAIQRPIALAPGSCQATLVVESNLAARRLAEPLSLAPDLHCALDPRLTLGVTHSARALSLFDSGGGLCLRGEDGGCPRAYDGTAIDALSPLRAGDAAIAARVRLVASSYDPIKPSLRAGALVRLRRGRVALLMDPHLAVGLANRDRGNRDQLNLPMRGQLQLTERIVVEMHTGVRGELSTFGDTFTVPFATGVQVSPSPAWDIGLEAALPRLLGPQNSFKERHVALYLTYRLAYGFAP
ncbi:MAG TPA: hypothetical protein VNO33_23405 [Kofleriaceae bacterium]|nr:hypothetical protein [Kofleriaceae bacterium]